MFEINIWWLEPAILCKPQKTVKVWYKNETFRASWNFHNLLFLILKKFIETFQYGWTILFLMFAGARSNNFSHVWCCECTRKTGLCRRKIVNEMNHPIMKIRCYYEILWKNNWANPCSLPFVRYRLLID